MSSSTHAPKFLIDENVHIALLRFLTQKGFDVKLLAKGSTDAQVAAKSKKENRVIVTNDEDFTECTNTEVFAIVWLRIPQNDSKSLTSSFENMAKSIKDFKGKIIILTKSKWDEFPLPEEEVIE